LNTLGDHIRARRLDLRLYQKDVAAQIIRTVDTITNWELNRCQPELQYIPRIIEFLGYDPEADGELQSLGARIKARRRRLGLFHSATCRNARNRPEHLQHWETNHPPGFRMLNHGLSTDRLSLDIQYEFCETPLKYRFIRLSCAAHRDMTRVDIPQGTLDMLILKTHSHDTMHGFAIALRIRQLTDEVIQIGECSLCLALYRMKKRIMLPDCNSAIIPG
jgi:transcriptional regulator with XRE-family HTH domain